MLTEKLSVDHGVLLSALSMGDVSVRGGGDARRPEGLGARRSAREARKAGTCGG